MIVNNPKVRTKQTSSKVFVDREKLQLDEREQAHDEATRNIVIPQLIDSETMREVQQMAKNTLKRIASERKLISVKIPQAEINTFKVKSEQEGLKYQTKLNQLIYLYNRGLLQTA